MTRKQRRLGLIGGALGVLAMAVALMREVTRVRRRARITSRLPPLVPPCKAEGKRCRA